MTCIVGLVSGGDVLIGGDSAVSNESDVRILASNNPKVIRKPSANGVFVIGFAGSVRAGQVIRSGFEVPPRLRSVDLTTYMQTSFVDSLREAIAIGGVTQYWGGQEFVGAAALIGHAGRLFCLDCDFQIAEYEDSFAAIGSGGQVATGALYGTEARSPSERLRIALEASARYCHGVKPPFFMVSTKAQETIQLQASASLQELKQVVARLG